MAEVKINRMWDDLLVEEFTNTDTGVIEVRSASLFGIKGELLATGDAKGKWSLNNKSRFLRDYNNAQQLQGRSKLTEKEFDKEFFTDGTNKFNNDRAAALNNPDNYDSPEEYAEKAKAHAENGLPDVKNPGTGKKNNSKGEEVDDPEKNADVQEEEKKEDTGGDFDLSDVSSIDEIDIGSKPGTNLRYPSGAIPDLGYDFVTFTAYKYKAGNEGGELELTVSGGDARIGSKLESITLPILPNITEANAVSWGEDNLNMIQAEFAEVAAGTIKSTVAKGVVDGIKEGFDASQKAISNIIKNKPELTSAIVAHFAGQAVGANVLGRSTGAVLNPNMELLFKGPTLRTFNFTFKFRPRNEDEQKVVRTIIRTFKRNMAVQRNEGELFLLTPNIFKVAYHHNGEPHPFMNRLKPCAMTSFNVSYTPDSNYMTYEDGGMTGYDVGFSMSEIVPIYADEQKDTDGMGY
jgi:hypothetical protein